LNASPRLLFSAMCFAQPILGAWSFVCLIVVVGAVLLEVAQLLTPDRNGRILHLIEKMAGAAVGIVTGRAILSFKRANRWFRN
jgi:VanZ family protein